MSLNDVLLASAARTATATATLPVIDGLRGVILMVDVTATADTPSVTPGIQVQDGNADWNNIWTAAAALTASGNTSYCIYPGASGGNFTEIDGCPIPMDCRLVMTHADADSITYSVRAHYLR